MRLQSILLALTIALATGPATAACYEEIGCTDSDQFSRPDLRDQSCDTLWEVRNEIYKEGGYCFKTSRAIDFFGNARCTTDNMNDVRMSRIERYNINQIVAVEREMGCN